MYKKVTTVTEEYTDGLMGGQGYPMLTRGGEPPKKYAPCIRVDIPLMIRLLEYAREEAKSDFDLHVLTAKMLEQSEGGKILTMSDYEELMDVEEASTASK